jgi:hypothetical protein
MSLEISSIEIWRPMQVLEPRPNYGTVRKSEEMIMFITKEYQTYRHPMAIHQSNSFLVGGQPPVRIEHIRILAEDFLILVLNPAVDAHDRLSSRVSRRKRVIKVISQQAAV